MVTKFYQHILALAFAINEINDNPMILPNVTLGFHTYDSYSDESMAYRTTLDLLFKSHPFVPNYKCGIQRKLIGVIGGLDGDTSSHMADFLTLYKIPQVRNQKAFSKLHTASDSLSLPSPTHLSVHRLTPTIWLIQLQVRSGSKGKWVFSVTPAGRAHSGKES